MKDYNFTYDSNGNPLLADCLKRGFGVYYGTPEVASAFDKLYRNIDGY